MSSVLLLIFILLTFIFMKKFVELHLPVSEERVYVNPDAIAYIDFPSGRPEIHFTDAGIKPLTVLRIDDILPGEEA